MSKDPLIFLPRSGECRPDSLVESGFDAPEPTSDEPQGTETNSMTSSQLKYADRRASPRFNVHFRLAMVYPQYEGRPARPMFHGKTHDISMSGLSMIVDYNVYQEGDVAIVLALPLEYPGATRKVVMSTAAMTYAIHSSKLDAFKIGLVFREFRGDGKELLAAALQRAAKQAGDAAQPTTSARLRARRPKGSQPLGW